VYTKNKDGVQFIISILVDNSLITCDDRTALNQFKTDLNNRFKCTDAGPVGYFLGINVHRDRPNGKLYLSQEHYLKALLDKYGMSDCKPSKVPLPTTFKVVPAMDEEFQAARNLPYPSIVGSLLYAASITRPNIAFASNLLCRYISKWTHQHYAAAKVLLQYIRGTTNLALTFSRENSKRALQGWADADWGGCLDTRQSTTSYVFKTYGGIVAWKSKRQQTIALSTTQAKLLASTDAGKEAIWLRQLLADLDLGPADNDPVQILYNNMGAIHLSKHQHDFASNKAFNMRSKWIREKTKVRLISVDWVPTEDNKADLLTKGVTADQTAFLRTGLGLADWPSKGQEAAKTA
jgi:hypothetical protein